MSATWANETFDGDRHVTPTADTVAHFPSRLCWCTPVCISYGSMPRDAWVDGPAVVIHRAVDGRRNDYLEPAARAS